MLALQRQRSLSCISQRQRWWLQRPLHYQGPRWRTRLTPSVSLLGWLYMLRCVMYRQRLVRRCERLLRSLWWRMSGLTGGRVVPLLVQVLVVVVRVLLLLPVRMVGVALRFPLPVSLPAARLLSLGRILNQPPRMVVMSSATEVAMVAVPLDSEGMSQRSV